MSTAVVMACRRVVIVPSIMVIAGPAGIYADAARTNIDIDSQRRQRRHDERRRSSNTYCDLFHYDPLIHPNEETSQRTMRSFARIAHDTHPVSIAVASSTLKVSRFAQFQIGIMRIEIHACTHHR
jgi:hypothetical protein